MVTGLLVAGGAVAAFATHTVCDDSDGNPNDDIHSTNVVPGVGTVFVGVDHEGDSTVLSGAGGWRGVCVRHTSPGGTTTYRSAFVGVSDPNPASTGATTTVLTCTGAPCSGTTTVLGDTGAEAGSVTFCSPTTGGTCTQGTTVYANGGQQSLPNKTGVDDNTTFPSVTQGNTAAHNIACVGSTCVRSVKASAGNVAIYVNRPADNPTTTVPLCASVGPNMSCP